MSRTHLLTRRRALQIAGLAALGAWVWGVPQLAQLRRPALTFAPLDGAAPFRILEQQGALSAVSPALVGLEEPGPAFAGSLCTALFGGEPGLAIAYFSDVQCPNCPAMEAAVSRIATQLGLPLRRIELPLLGDKSRQAARLIIAAGQQNPGADMAGPLTHVPGPITPARIAALAQSLNLDHDRLLRDARSDATTTRLEQYRALARKLGIYGTPGTVIGRTVILGTLPDDTITSMIDLEREMGPICN